MRLLVRNRVGLGALRIPTGDAKSMASLLRNTMGLGALRIPAGDAKKMQIPVGSPEAGTVKRVLVIRDQFLNEEDPIVELD